MKLHKPIKNSKIYFSVFKSKDGIIRHGEKEFLLISDPKARGAPEVTEGTWSCRKPRSYRRNLELIKKTLSYMEID